MDIIKNKILITYNKPSNIAELHPLSTIQCPFQESKRESKKNNLGVDLLKTT